MSAARCGPVAKFDVIGGVDAAFSADGAWCVAAAVVWERESGVVLEEQLAVRRAEFPYVSGRLWLREGAAVLAAVCALRARPDVFLYDGHGIAHPRRFGAACSLGMATGLPVIGCAKALLVGTHEPLGRERGSRVPVVYRGQIVGSALRTREGVRPVYVSVGYGISQATAEEVVLCAAARFRLPEPLRLADQRVRAAQRQLDAERCWEDAARPLSGWSPGAVRVSPAYGKAGEGARGDEPGGIDIRTRQRSSAGKRDGEGNGIQ